MRYSLPTMNHPCKDSNLGKWAEEEAVRYLQSQGVTILARNYRTKQGEIDIIALEGSVLLLVEVKSRKETQKEWFEMAVSKNKIKRILKTAETYIDKNKIVFQEMRVDVIWLIRNKNSIKLMHQKEFV